MANHQAAVRRSRSRRRCGHRCSRTRPAACTLTISVKRPTRAPNGSRPHMVPKSTNGCRRSRTNMIQPICSGSIRTLNRRYDFQRLQYMVEKKRAPDRASPSAPFTHFSTRPPADIRGRMQLGCNRLRYQPTGPVRNEIDHYLITHPLMHMFSMYSPSYEGLDADSYSQAPSIVLYSQVLPE
jgi:hypothetical protein